MGNTPLNWVDPWGLDVGGIDQLIVYNFEVADWHTYYVGQLSVLVHNMCADFRSANVNVGDIVKISSNARVNQIAQDLGCDSAEILKKELVGVVQHLVLIWCMIKTQG